MSPVLSPQILGLGGYPAAAMARYLLGLARGPRVLFDTTANPYPDTLPELDGVELTLLSFYPWRPAGLAEHDTPGMNHCTCPACNTTDAARVARATAPGA